MEQAGAPKRLSRSCCPALIQEGIIDTSGLPKWLKGPKATQPSRSLECSESYTDAHCGTVRVRGGIKETALVFQLAYLNAIHLPLRHMQVHFIWRQISHPNAAPDNMKPLYLPCHEPKQGNSLKMPCLYACNWDLNMLTLNIETRHKVWTWCLSLMTAFPKEASQSPEGWHLREQLAQVRLSVTCCSQSCSEMSWLQSQVPHTDNMVAT